ncbi:metal-sensing transcriptional repressor [Rhodococcus hoagii]|nr:metal-sensing transcriptional repressor [Prescottella equi]
MNGSAAAEDLLKRLRRIEGQVQGISRMIADDRYCIDVLTQVSAATSALAVVRSSCEAHLAGCVVEARRRRPGGGRQVKEASDAIARLVRS